MRKAVYSNGFLSRQCYRATAKPPFGASPARDSIAPMTGGRL